MDGFVGVPDTNSDSDKHVKCSKGRTTSEKHVPQPTIAEKHKQKNQEILERKHKLSNAGRKHSRKMSESESRQLAAKLALERHQQKKVEVFDSHAINFTQHKDTDKQGDIFLPRHLKKRQSSQSLSLNNVKEESNLGSKPAFQASVADGENDKQSIVDGEDGSDVLRSGKDSRRGSLAYGILRPQQQNLPQHDTPRAYFKFRNENMAKEDRLKRIQSDARLRVSDDKAVHSLNGIAVRKPVGSRTILPPLSKTNGEAKSKARTDAELNRAIYNEKLNNERHGKLPKISRNKNKGKEGSMGRDPRFQKLISCLVPLSEKSGISPPFSRKRHYTMSS